MRLVGLLALFLAVTPSALGQRVTFGVTAGTNATNDFRTETVRPPTGIPEQQLIRAVRDESQRFLVGPSIDIHLWRGLSFEAGALHRSVRRFTLDTYDPPFELPGGRVIANRSNSLTYWTWQFPLLAKYRFETLSPTPFFEVGTTFRPAENKEQFGFTAGAGIGIHTGSLLVEPGVRYTRWSGVNVHQIPSTVEFVAAFSRPRPSGGVSAFGERLAVGAVAGLAITKDFRAAENLGGLTYLRTSEFHSPLIGLSLEWRVARRLSLEINGLYRPLTFEYRLSGTGGEEVLPDPNQDDFTVLTWQFPVLVKYRLSEGGVRPFLAAGPSFRARGNLNGAEPSHLGATAGAGVEFNTGRLAISPSVRFTHWAKSDQPDRSPLQNQVELVFGLSF